MNDVRPVPLREVRELFLGNALVKMLAFHEFREHYNMRWPSAGTDEKPAVEIPGLGVFQSQTIGSVSNLSNTWLWSWANKNLPEPAVNLSSMIWGTLKKHYNPPELTEGNIPLGSFDLNGLLEIAVGMVGNVSGIFHSDINGQGTGIHAVLDLPLKNIKPPFAMKRILKVAGAIERADQFRVMRFFLTDIGFSLAAEENDPDGGRRDIYRDTLDRKFVVEKTWASKSKYEIRFKGDAASDEQDFEVAY